MAGEPPPLPPSDMEDAAAMAHYHNLLRAYNKAHEQSTAPSAPAAHINHPPTAMNSPTSQMNSEEFNIALGGDDDFVVRDVTAS